MDARMAGFVLWKIVLPVISLAAIAAGYYLLWVNTPEMQYEDIANRVVTGVTLTIAGGLGAIIYMLKLGK